MNPSEGETLRLFARRLAGAVLLRAIHDARGECPIPDENTHMARERALHYLRSEPAKHLARYLDLGAARLAHIAAECEARALEDIEFTAWRAKVPRFGLVPVPAHYRLGIALPQLSWANAYRRVAAELAGHARV